MELVAGLSRCSKSELRGCSDCQEGFLSGEQAGRGIWWRRRCLISQPLSGPNVSSPISSNGQDCIAQTFEHFRVLVSTWFPCRHFSAFLHPDTCGYFWASIPIHPAGVVTDRQEQGGGEWLTHKVAVADNQQITASHPLCIPMPAPDKVV